MNHDATHCLDYKKGVCPASCYRGQLTEDLENRSDLYYLPISWASFYESQECPYRTLPLYDKITRRRK